MRTVVPTVYWEENYYWLSLQLPTPYRMSQTLLCLPKLSFNRQWGNFYFTRQKIGLHMSTELELVFWQKVGWLKPRSKPRTHLQSYNNVPFKKIYIKNTHWLLGKTDTWVTQELIYGLDWNKLVVLCLKSLGQCTFCVCGLKFWHDNTWPLRNDLGMKHQHWETNTHTHLHTLLTNIHKNPDSEYKHYTLVWLHA